MVNRRYSAIYTDDFGCEKAEVYFLEKRLYLNVRGMTFYSEEYGVDLYSKNLDEARKKFLLKDDELIGYVLDIQVPVIIENKTKVVIKKVIIRLERQKNYYNNLLIYEDAKIHSIQGYDLKNLLYNMKSELPQECNLKVENLYQCK